MESRPHLVDGKVVEPKRFVPKEEFNNILTNQLCVSARPGNLFQHSDEELRSYFSQYGRIEKVRAPHTFLIHGILRYAIVYFDDYDPVDKCILVRVHTIAGNRCYATKEPNFMMERKLHAPRTRTQRRVEPYHNNGRSAGSGSYRRL